jgi:hypothetical protein
MAAGRTNDLIVPSLATLPFRGVLATGKSEPDVPSVLSPQKAHNSPTQHSQRHTTQCYDPAGTRRHMCCWHRWCWCDSLLGVTALQWITQPNNLPPVAPRYLQASQLVTLTALPCHVCNCQPPTVCPANSRPKSHLGNCKLGANTTVRTHSLGLTRRSRAMCCDCACDCQKCVRPRAAPSHTLASWTQTEQCARAVTESGINGTGTAPAAMNKA